MIPTLTVSKSMTIKEWFDAKALKPIYALIFFVILFEAIFLIIRVQSYYEEQESLYLRTKKSIELGISLKNRSVIESSIGIAIEGLNASQFLLCINDKVEFGYPVNIESCSDKSDLYNITLRKKINGISEGFLLVTFSRFPLEPITVALLFMVILSIFLMVTLSLRIQKSFYIDVISSLTEGLMGDEKLKLSEMESLRQLRIEKEEKDKKVAIGEARNQISRQVAHDIQSPIGALKAAIDHIDVNKNKSISLIRKSIERVENILQDLKIKIPDASTSSSLMKITDINNFVEEVVAEKISEFTGKAKIRFHSFDRIMKCKIDPTQMARVISNIINNGVEATPSGYHPKIFVKIEKESREALIQIFDNGTGISKEKRSLVTQYGFSEGKENGSGTGLSHAVAVIENHRGKLELLGKDENDLNLVQIRLPLT